MENSMYISIYNPDFSKNIYHQKLKEISEKHGADITGSRILYKSQEGKYFLHIIYNFLTHVDVNNDDLNPIYKYCDVIEEKIVPIPKNLARMFIN